MITSSIQVFWGKNIGLLLCLLFFFLQSKSDWLYNTWFLLGQRNCQVNSCCNIMIELIRYEDTSGVVVAGNLALIALTGRYRLSPIVTQLLTIYWKTIQRKFLAKVFCNHHFLGNDIWTPVSTRRLIPPWPNKLEMRKYVEGVIKILLSLPLAQYISTQTCQNASREPIMGWLLITLFGISLASALHSLFLWNSAIRKSCLKQSKSNLI